MAGYFGLKVIELQIHADGSGKTNIVGATNRLPLVDQIAIHCAGQASRTVFKCRSHALAEVEISELVGGLTEDQRFEIRNAGYRRAIEVVKSNAPEVERLASQLIQKRRVSGAELIRVERMTA